MMPNPLYIAPGTLSNLFAILLLLVIPAVIRSPGRFKPRMPAKGLSATLRDVRITQEQATRYATRFYKGVAVVWLAVLIACTSRDMGAVIVGLAVCAETVRRCRALPFHRNTGAELSRLPPDSKQR